MNPNGATLNSTASVISYPFTTSAFLVSSVTPSVSGATSATTPPIALTFNYPVSSSSLSNFATLTDTTTSTVVATLSGVVTGNVITLTGVPALTNFNTYQVDVNCASVKDLESPSQPLSNWSGCTSSSVYSSDYSWQFSVETNPPTVVAITSINPALVFSGGTNWLADNTPTISIQFSEAMDDTADAGSVTNSSNICLVAGTSASSCSGQVPATLSYNSANNTVTLLATPPAPVDGPYTVYVSNNVQDLAGNFMLVSVPFTFTVDATPPTVASISPTNGATSVGTVVPIVIKFTEAGSGMNVNTLNNITVTDQNGNQVPCSSSYKASTKTLTLTPAGGLNFSSTYTVSISGSVTDVAGNPLAPPFTSSFSTAAVTESTYAAYPSFLCSTIQPNVLIILDNSNSFDFDMNGNAVGSPHCALVNGVTSCSKSVLARQDLISMINAYGGKMRIGLMSYQLPTDIQSDYLYRNTFFQSFDPSTYCPNPPPSCQAYCNTEEPKTGTYTMSANESDCYTKCRAQAGATSFVTNTSRPAITTAAGVNNGSNGGTPANSNYPATPPVSPLRQQYCSLTYPRTQTYTDTNNNTYYYATPGSMYTTSPAASPFYNYSPTTAYSTEEYNANTQSWPQSTSASNGITNVPGIPARLTRPISPLVTLLKSHSPFPTTPWGWDFTMSDLSRPGFTAA